MGYEAEEMEAAADGLLSEREEERLVWLQDHLAGLALGSSLRRSYEDELWALLEIAT